MAYARTPPTMISMASTSASTSQATSSSKEPTPKRKQSGCLTCRLRKKRCDETKPLCQTCNRLGINCLGYEKKRPGWMKEDDQISRATAEMKQKISETKSKRMRLYWASQAGRSGSVSTTSPEDLKSDNEDPPQTVQSRLIAHPTSSNTDEMDLSDLFSADSLWQTDLSDTNQLFEQFSNFTDNSMTLLSNSFTTEYQADSNASTSDWDQLWLTPFLPSAHISSTPETIPQSLAPPMPFASASSFTDPSDIRFLHHYLNVVLPLQYRFNTANMSDYVAPLALEKASVLHAVCGLAALHMAAHRTKQLADPQDPDVTFAKGIYGKIVDDLRVAPLDEFSNDDVVVPAIFSTSFHLFSGGTSTAWKESVAICQRCLAILLSVDNGLSQSNRNLKSRHQNIIPALVWMDIVSTVTRNTASTLISRYRVLLSQALANNQTGGRLVMEKVMGCDSTTLLAIAEMVALSEWKERCAVSGTLSYRDLLERVRAIERLLEEREWKEFHLFKTGDANSQVQQLMSEVFFHGAKVFLSTIVNGSFPNVPETYEHVQQTIQAAVNLDAHLTSTSVLLPNDYSRALVLPLTVAGCHASTPSQYQFFRDRFQKLSPEATAFGNTRAALQLMEEVWKRRDAQGRSIEVGWRKVMMELWPEGLLLV